MKRYRTALPPLDLLVFFEAAHRVGSFTGCAAELHVTQAAVSKRIHQLEEWIGEPLFIRHGKRLLPTESGQKLYETAGMALEFLSQGLGNLRENAQRPLSIAANTVVTMFWLASKLQAFGLSGDACPTRLTTSDHGNDLLSGRNDLLVTYGNGTFPGWRSILLLEEVMAPVASPELAEALRANQKCSFADLSRCDRPPLLNFTRLGPDWVDWRIWASSLSLGNLADWRIRAVSAYSQTIGEAIRGKGIALASLTIHHDELKSGRLVQLSREALRTGRGYYLCYGEKSVLSSDATRLANFLIEAAGQPKAELTPNL